MQHNSFRYLSFSFLLVGSLTTGLVAQPTPGSGQQRVEYGQKIEIKGVVVDKVADHLTVKAKSGSEFSVVLTPQSKIEERKKNFFRSAKAYSSDDLVMGLSVRVKGWGDASGNLVASSVKFTQDELFVAESIAERLAPVESELEQTQGRLAQVEGDVEKGQAEIKQLSGEMDEVEGSLRLARQEARTAQGTADSAISMAEAAHSRISSLDDYEVREDLSILFKAGSSVLTSEAEVSLGEFAKKSRSSEAYLIEVVGFASADGGEDYNRRLSRLRADAVLRYLAENQEIPLRRFIAPHGFGENRPIADNQTREGRQQNRRVEIRLLANDAINDAAEAPAAGPK